MSLFASFVRLGTANTVLLVGQITTIIALGIIADPAQIGLFLLAQSIAQPIAAAAMLRFDAAIPAARSLREARTLFVLAILALVVVIGVAAAVFAGLRHADLFGLETVGVLHIAAILALAVSLAANQAGRYWAIRTDRLKRIEGATYIRGLGTLLVRGGLLALIASGSTAIPVLFQASGLLIAEVLVTALAAAALIPFAHIAAGFANLRGAVLNVVLRRNWKFPTIEAPSTVLDTVAVNAPMYLISHFYGLVGAAAFGLAMRAMAVPVGQLALAMTEVIQTRYSAMLRQRQFAALNKLFRKSVLLSMAGGTVVCVLCYLLLEIVVTMIAGPKLRQFAEICVIIAPWVALSVTINLNSRLMALLRRQELKLVYDVFSIASVPVLAAYAHLVKPGLLTFVTAVTISQCFGYVIYWTLLQAAVSRVMRHGMVRQGRRVRRR